MLVDDRETVDQDTMVDNLCRQPFDTWVLHAKVKNAHLPILEMFSGFTAFLNSKISTPVLSPVDM